MKLVFLGTSAAQPTKTRGLACICLETDGEILMFDAGEAAQIAFLRSGLGWNKKMRIFVTHLHGDHCIGILGLLQTMSMQGRTKPLEIYGPGGIEGFIASNVKALGFGLSFPVLINQVSEGEVVKSRKYTISACKASHSVTAFAYLFKEKDKPGRFYPEKAKALQVPKGRAWKRLQDGNNVSIGERVVTPDQVLGETRPGRKIGISGDTMPSAELERFFGGCDYLVFDATFLEELRDRALETRHSTARQAAVLARDAGVKNLVLTHYSTRYRDETGHVREAEEIHGSVIAAKDMLEIEVK